MDNTIREFSLAEPLWFMNHYTRLCKYSKFTCDIWDFSVFWRLFYKLIITLSLVGHKMIIAALRGTLDQKRDVFKFQTAEDRNGKMFNESLLFILTF